MGVNKLSRHNPISDQPLNDQAVLAALPAYVQGTLEPQHRAAVDAYLNRQVDLFRQLDIIEASHGPLGAKSIANQGQQIRNEQLHPTSKAAYAQVMEGYVSTHQLPDNPLLMRKAPQRITDHRTGQRFIVPRRPATQTTTGKYPQSEQPTSWGHSLLWGLLALAAVAAMTLIGLYQLRLQQQLAAAESALAARQQSPAAVNSYKFTDLFGATPPTTTWLISARQASSPLGALFVDGQTGTLLIQHLPPLPPDQIYQLWLVDHQTTVYGVADFTITDADQAKWVAFQLPLPAARVVQMGISIEPASGSTQPSSDFLLSSALR